MLLRYTETGFLVILPGDDPREAVDAMLATGYSEEFCVSPSFEPGFIAGLMEAGFLVMSARIGGEEGGGEDSETGESQEGGGGEPLFLPLPKLHLSRSALFFDRLRVKKSIRRLLGRYELRPDSDFDLILDRCVETHGDGWLTPPLVGAIRAIRRGGRPRGGAYPMSLALYRGEKLVAGEFGVKAGRVYTSYSGYYSESGSGTAQIILAARYLQEHGFAFLDLGMPLGYKNDLGAVDISPEEFVRLFRLAQRPQDPGHAAPARAEP